MNRTFGDQLGVIIVIGCSIFLLSSLVVKYFNSKKLVNSFEITEAFIYDVGFKAGRSGSGADYRFVIDNEEYQGSFDPIIFCKRLSPQEKVELFATPILVAYHPEDPSINKILIKTKHYKKFAQPYPDGEVRKVIMRYFECDK